MKDNLEKANTGQRVFGNSDTRRMVRVKSWAELAECGRPIRRANRKETDIHPPKKNDTTVCLFIHDMRELCSKVVEIDGDGVELKTGDGWDLSPWMYEELETPDPRAEEQGDKAIKIRVRSWKELLKCRTPSPDPASPYYLNEQIMALCNKVFEVVLEDDGRAIIEGWSIQPWMYEELEAPDPRVDERLQHNEEHQRKKAEPRLGPCLSCGEIKVLDMEGSMGMCRRCLPPSRTINVHHDYKKLCDVLVAALDQAQSGKGRERHAAGEPFEQQEICQNTRAVGYGYPLGQARKKARESLRLLEDRGPDAAIAECLGAINYLAAAVVVMQEKGGEA